MIQEYENFGPEVKNQLMILNDIYKNDPKVIEKNNELGKRYGINTNNIHNYALYSTYTTRDFLLNNFNKLYAYNSHNNNDHIKFDKILCTKSHAVLLEGKYNNMPVIIKYYLSNNRTTKYEINVYNKLKKIGCDVPLFYDSFMVFNEHVLVMEKLEKVTKKDNIYNIGRDIIGQLSYLHQFAIHSDIKPDNIMKRVSENNIIKYFLIDYGGVANKREEDGYHRWIWTHKWTSQKNIKKNHITYPKNDFIELLYTLNHLHNNDDNHNFKHICTACLGCYNKQINRVGKKLYPDINYDKLIHSLHSHKKK